MFIKSKTESSKKKTKIKLLYVLKYWPKIAFLALTIIASILAYLYFSKKSNVIEIFPDDAIIKVKTKINTNLEDLIKKDSIVYDIIMKQRELEGKKTQLSESTEDPISVLSNKDSATEDIFSKYTFTEQNQGFQNQDAQKHQDAQKQKHNFKITETKEEDKNRYNLAEKLKTRQKQKYFYCDLNYFYDKTQAEKEYAKIRYIYAKIISTYPHIVHSKQKNDKYVYVLSIGKFHKFEEARSLCRKLIIQKQNCMVNQW